MIKEMEAYTFFLAPFLPPFDKPLFLPTAMLPKRPHHSSFFDTTMTEKGQSNIITLGTELYKSKRNVSSLYTAEYIYENMNLSQGP